MRKRILYRIVVETNGWIARRDPMFKPHHTKAVIESGLTLKEAREMLLDMFNAKFECEVGYAPNWGIAVIKTKKFADGANKTYQDGTRSFSWDSRIFSIEIWNTQFQLG